VAVALSRVAVGFIFLWVFLDKFFGLGYATPADKAWIHGGSPTNGSLSTVAVGPFESRCHLIAGTCWANTLFMLGPVHDRRRADPGRRHMSRSRECTCNTPDRRLVTNHVTLPAVNQVEPASPDSCGFRRAPRWGLDGACLACRRRITPTLPLGSITQ